MPPSSDQLAEYLGSDESLDAVYTATISEHSSWKTVSLGVTDRRLFYLSEDGWFANISYESISGVRSRPKVTRTYHVNDYRLVLGAGGLVAVLGFLSVIAFTSSLTIPFLALATVVGLVAAETMRRHVEEVSVEEIVELTDHVDEFDARAALRRFRNDMTGRVNLHQSLMLGSGFLAVLSLVGILLLASSGGEFLGILLFLGGIGLVDYAHRHREEFDGFEITRNHQTEVSITTDDRTVYIRVDSSSDLGQRISKMVFGEGA